ncbi:rhodanese-like domain-containing protein [Paenalkalicoccus suaedae]|uniref:Rhodanese-like domain-containing protein n=1 Tax=Paenalkalicoccus suaedae TaxID=2592382 RepID=A0A859FEL7_9BACI|nr:rhodanese-like domain-containing protein [Paenalkalicoccus suaedae]QKS71793.1 rhodanese-like domain-containing protein [Paenalkalicoccus suaedae]
MSYELDGVKQYSKEELKELLVNPGNKVIIDVREEEEYTNGHIPSVPLAPMGTIPDLISGFQDDKEYVFVCRSGNRSQRVSQFLQQQGLTNVANYEGGMLVWDGDTLQGDEKQLQSAEELADYSGKE